MKPFTPNFTCIIINTALTRRRSKAGESMEQLVKWEGGPGKWKVPTLMRLNTGNERRHTCTQTGICRRPMPTYGVQCNWGAQHRDNRAKCTALIGARPPKSTPSHATRNAWGCLASKGTLCTRYNTCGDGQRRKEWRIMPQAARQ